MSNYFDYEAMYMEALGEQDGQFAGDAWRDDYNPRVALEKKLSGDNMTFKEDHQNSTLCPECNSQMKSRTGKFGVFWGCINYPACKGTRDSQGRSKADRDKEKNSEYERKEFVSQGWEREKPPSERFSFKKNR